MPENNKNDWAAQGIKFQYSPYTPFFAESQILYTCCVTSFLEPAQFTSWEDEQLSWETSCYIHGNLNPSPHYRFSGPGAKDFLKKYMVNTFERFPLRTGKHGFTVSERGYITSDGIILRTGEEEYETYWILSLMMANMMDGMNYDMKFEDLTPSRFLLQVGGPKSLSVIEKTLGLDCHDLKFNHFKNVNYKGYEIRVYRMGMAGSLAYELHGPLEFSSELYSDIYAAGQEYGIKRLGWDTYLMQHGMNGYPQFGQHYGLDNFTAKEAVSGSMSDLALEEYLHTPYDVNQGFCVKFDHDFVGRAALEKIAPNPPRKMVSLEWNADDIGDVYRSQFTDDPFPAFPGPTQYNSSGILTYHDKVMKDGKLIGASTGRTHTLYYNRMISICYMDKEYCEDGTEVIIIWGNPGTKQKEIRAKVTRYPYYNEMRNETYDVNQTPDGLV